MKHLLLLLCLSSLFACTGIPEDIEPVENFDANAYLGQWYEIARLDHSFERGLSNVTAEYSLNADDTIKVINLGFDENSQTWSEAEGVAQFVDETDIGYLKVSFFGPFYGSYVVFELDESYQYSFVTGNTKDYLWLLSRTPTVSDALLNDFINTANDKGYNTDELIFVDQSRNQ